MNQNFVNLFTVLLLFSFSFSFVTVFGIVENFSTDKSLYNEGEDVVISGVVDYSPDSPFVIIQIVTPDASGFASIASVIPLSDGSFSTTIRAGGPTWTSDGTYTIRVAYGDVMEKTITFKQSSTYSSSETSTNQNSSSETSTNQNSSSETSTNQNSSSETSTNQNSNSNLSTESSNLSTNHSDLSPSEIIDQFEDKKTTNLKTQISGFPSLEKPPNIILTVTTTSQITSLGLIHNFQKIQ